MRILPKAVALIAVLAPLAGCESAAAPAEVGWLDSVEKALVVAKEQRKPILIDFTAPW